MDNIRVWRIPAKPQATKPCTLHGAPGKGGTAAPLCNRCVAILPARDKITCVRCVHKFSRHIDFVQPSVRRNIWSYEVGLFVKCIDLVINCFQGMYKSAKFTTSSLRRKNGRRLRSANQTDTGREELHAGKSP